MAHQCWTCGMYNDSRKSLKNHCASEHRHLAVICMYCYPKERTLGRINDLKKHVQMKHDSLAQSHQMAFYTESNGFYLALDPYNYVKHSKPTPIESECAKKAMNAVRLLIPALENPSRTLPQWESGWLQAIGTPLQDDVPCLAGAAPRRVGMLKLPSINSMSMVPTMSPLGSPLSPLPMTPVNSSSLAHDLLYSPSHPEMTATNSPEYYASKLPEFSSTDKYTPSHPEMTLPDSDIFYLNKEKRELMFMADSKYYSAKLLQTPSKYCNVENQNALLYTDMHRKPILGREYYELSKTLGELLGISEPDIAEISQINDLVVSAVKSLTTGHMPLFPPGLRNWNALESPIKLTNTTTGRTVRWPPADWKHHSPEHKRLNFMSACFRLNEGENGLPTSSEEIFDKYNFLLLNGSQPVDQKCENARRRFLNFKAIRNYIKYGTHADLASMLLSSKCTSQLPVLAEIGKVPLRI